MLLVINDKRLEAMSAEVREKILSYYNSKNNAQVTLESLKSSGTEIRIPFRYTEVDITGPCAEYHKKCFPGLTDSDNRYDWDYATANFAEDNICGQRGLIKCILNTFIASELEVNNRSSDFCKYHDDLIHSVAMIEGLYPEIVINSYPNNPTVTLGAYAELSGYVPYVTKS